MSPAASVLPDGFAVRVHDDVEVGSLLIAGTRVLRLSDPARQMIVDRTVTVSSPASAVLASRLLDLDLADPVLPPVAPSVDDLTVVTPVRDNAPGVDRLLTALGPEVSVVVVDDASAEPRALADVAARHRARLVALDHNVGPAAARNVGLRQVTTPFVAFVDSDVEVSTGSLAGLRRHLADPGLALVAPRVRTVGGGRGFQRYEAACGSLDLGAVAATLRPWSSTTYVPSACLLARVEAIGYGFDPALRSGEDVDLVWRVQADGWRVRHAAEIEVQHDARPSMGTWLRRKAFYGTSAAPLARRHGDRVAPAVLTPAVATVLGGVLLQRRWSWAAAAIGAGVFARETDRPLADLPASRRAAVVVSTAGVMLGQGSALAVRHWWPVSVGLALVSKRARRAVAAVAVVDGVLAHRRSGAELDPARFILARRADDLAYGAGVWVGAVRARSARCLMPRWVWPRRDRARS
ncbi:MAG: mftF [Aeromicrobium sp.]|nr:mftF [Aeromicrobium sp.]